MLRWILVRSRAPCSGRLQTPPGPEGSNGSIPIYGKSFVGNLDEARIFTFAPGQLSPADLDYSPEPSSLALVGIGAAALAGCVRRRHTDR